MKNHKLVELLSVQGWLIVTMESCTGGALASAISDVPGSSAVLMDSFITYSNKAKVELGVPQALIDEHTVYSVKVAGEMAKQAVRNSVATGQVIGVGITGSLTREDPNNPNSNPGTVYCSILIYDKDKNQGRLSNYDMSVTTTDRKKGKQNIVEQVLKEILNLISK